MFTTLYFFVTNIYNVCVTWQFKQKYDTNNGSIKSVTFTRSTFSVLTKFSG